MPPAKRLPNCGPIGPGSGAELPLDTPLGAGRETELDVLASIIGLDLSTVTAFFNFIPFLMSPNKASLPPIFTGGIDGAALFIDGGGGGGGPPPGGGGGGGGGIDMFQVEDYE